MKSFIIAAAVGGLVPAVAATGYAQVVNACGAPIYLCDVPAPDAVPSQAPTYTTIADSAAFTHVWAPLSTGGWSIKMSNTDVFQGGSDCFANNNIVQYEWNMDDGQEIWWDISYVNGNPIPEWQGFTTDSSCTANYQGYENPEDNGAMQAGCPNSEVVLTVMLCTNSDTASSVAQKFDLGTALNQGSLAGAGNQAGSGGSPGSSYGSSDPTTAPSATAAAPTTTAAPATTSTAGPVNVGTGENEKNVVENNSPAADSSTTLATQASSENDSQTTPPPNPAVATVWNTQVVTEAYTHTVWQPRGGHPQHKRHEHRHGHAHQNTI